MSSEKKSLEPLPPEVDLAQGKGKGKLDKYGFQTSHLEPSSAGPYLCLFLLSGVDDGGTADLGDLAALAIEGPAADFVPNDVLYEQDPSIKAQRQLIKQFNVFQHIVVRIAAKEEVIKQLITRRVKGHHWRGSVSTCRPLISTIPYQYHKKPKKVAV